MIVGGIMLRSNSETIGGDYFPMLDDKILPLMSNVGITPSFTLQEVLEMIATVLTVTGGIIGGVTFIGFCEAGMESYLDILLYIVFGLTRPGLKLTIYRTRGKHANHYTADVVLILVEEIHDLKLALIKQPSHMLVYI
jgi:hypothetical protein